MKKYELALGVAVAASLSGACDRPPCDQKLMLIVINEDMKADGKNPDQYKLAEVKVRSDGVYVGMSMNYSPTYRYHYLIDPKSCRVIDAKYDQ